MSSIFDEEERKKLAAEIAKFFRDNNWDDDGFEKVAVDVRPDKNLGDEVSEFVVTNPVSRVAGMGIQGVANAKLNPFGYMARSMGVDTKPLEAKNVAEKMMEKGSEYAYDGAGLSAIGALAGSAGYLGNGAIKSVFGGGNVMADAAASFGAGSSVSAFEPNSIIGQFLAAIGGAMGAGAVGRLPGQLKQAGQKTYDYLVNAPKEVEQIAKSYDALKTDPFRGQADDVMARMTPYGQTPVDLKRGAAIKDEYGNVITKGKQLLAQTGTDRNFGMNKGIYRHELDKADMQQLPYMIRDYAPAEVTPRGQKIYRVPYGNKEQPLVAALTPEDNGFGVASVYRNDRNLGARSNPQSQQKTYPALADGYTAGDSSFVPAGGDYRNNLSPYGTVVNGIEDYSQRRLTEEELEELRKRYGYGWF